MTLIIDDNNVCECGAYFEDSGWCVNGHLRLEKHAIVEHTEKIKNLRMKVLYHKELLTGVTQRLHETDEWETLQNANIMVQSTQAELEEAEAVAKIAIEIHNEETEEKKGFGWQVKEFKTINYEEADALEWARQRPITANLISLKKSPFEKAARALIDTGMEEAPDFVTLGTEKRVQLTKELG